MINVTFRGNVYQIPEPNDSNNQALTDYLNALSTGAVPFPTTADIDLGAAFGLKSLYFKTRAANPAASGLVRLALSDLIAFRNNANSADLALGVGAQDQLQWRGSDVTGNPMLGASSAAGQSIPNSASTIVVFGTVEVDTDSGYNSGTGRYTVPIGKGGPYLITGEIVWNAAPGLGAQFSIFKNAVQTKATFVDASVASAPMQISALLNFAAGDIIDLRVLQASGGAVVLSSNALVNYFALKRIPL